MADRERHRDVAGEIFDRKAWSREIRLVAKDYFSPITAVASTIAKNISFHRKQGLGIGAKKR